MHNTTPGPVRLLGNPFAARAALAMTAFAFIGCTDDVPDYQPSAFELKFAAVANGKQVGCTNVIMNMGPSAGDDVGISDLRFYVSNIKLFDAAGNSVDFTLETNDFQYNHSTGTVSLVDLTSNTQGSCVDSAVAFAEGTARTHTAITGTTVVQRVSAVSFDIGVPQALMREVIANNTEEGAPSPLNEMYWNWASGYRHFVMNFAIRSKAGVAGSGFMHIGSRNCGPMDGKALEDRDACQFINNPSIRLDNFALASQTVALDVPGMLKELDFISPIYDENFEIIGQGPGVECHSAPSQPDCPIVFKNFGVDIATGKADHKTNSVFSAATL